MMELRRQIMEKLSQQAMDKIASAPKPTPTAEVLAVVKQFENTALNLDEIAEILNIANPGGRRARASDFSVNDLRKHPELRVIRTASETMVRHEVKKML